MLSFWCKNQYFRCPNQLFYYFWWEPLVNSLLFDSDTLHFPPARRGLWALVASCQGGALGRARAGARQAPRSRGGLLSGAVLGGAALTNGSMGVLINGRTPKSSIEMWFSIINHPFWDTSILGKHYINQSCRWYIPTISLLFFRGDIPSLGCASYSLR